MLQVPRPSLSPLPFGAQTEGARSFTSSEVAVLRECFDDADPTASGLLPCGALWRVVSSAGLEVSQALVDQVVASLEADNEAVLTFAEFVDVVAILADAS